MNNHKQLIIRLIQQDMKHQQLVEAICQAGFETDIHNLQLLPIVANLMGIPTHQIPDRWVEIYINCLGQTTLYPITPLAENLLPLAEECYLLLSNLKP